MPYPNSIIFLPPLQGKEAVYKDRSKNYKEELKNK